MCRLWLLLRWINEKRRFLFDPCTYVLYVRQRRHCSFDIDNNSFSCKFVYYRSLIAHTNANNYTPTISDVRHFKQTRTWVTHVYLCKQKFTLQRYYTCVYKNTCFLFTSNIRDHFFFLQSLMSIIWKIQFMLKTNLKTGIRIMC